MSRLARIATCTLLATAIVVAAGCGQRGPLTLPEDARPIERLPQPTVPATPQDDEDEQRNER